MVQKIDREQIIAQALKTLAHSDSFTQFSLRKVALDLNVDVSTLYWHFKNKQAILQEMASYVIGQIQVPDCNLEWSLQLKQLFSNVFDTYERYPLSAILMVETIPSSLVRLKLIDHMIDIMTKAGIDEHTANMAITSVDFLLTGLMLDLATENRFRQLIMNQQDSELAQHVKKIRENVRVHDLKHMQSSIKMRNQFSAKEQFMMSLDLMIAGVQSHLK